MESIKQLFQVFTSKELFIEWLLAVNISIGKKLLRKKAEIEVETYSVNNKDIDMRTAPQAIKNNMIYDANVLQERWDICRQCPHLKYDETNPDTDRKDGRCTECGCFMNVKCHYATAECPIGKWKKFEKNKKNA